MYSTHTLTRLHISEYLHVNLSNNRFVDYVMTYFVSYEIENDRLTLFCTFLRGNNQALHWSTARFMLSMSNGLGGIGHLWRWIT